MKITSKEYCTIENFKPLKIIDIYANGNFLTRYKTTNTAESLRTLKEKQRHERRAAKDNRKLAIKDNYNNIYHYLYNHTFNSITEEYEQLKILKNYLERTKAATIQVQGENGVKEYKKDFSIVYVGDSAT